MKKAVSILGWSALVVLGAWAYAALAWHRGEPLNSAYLLTAALCSYAIGFRFYSKWIAARVLALDDRRATPCLVHDDGRDYVQTNKWIVFGHHFAAIAGPGPLVGPVLAAQFGYLPCTLWILIGVVLGGAVQDFVILFASMRRDGKSLGQMVKEEMNPVAGLVGWAGIMAIMTILLAVLALVVVKALAESPWGLFTVGATVPIALLMGGYLRFMRVGKVLEATGLGVGLLLLAVWGGKYVHFNPALAKIFTLKDLTLAWGIIIYGLAASILPVWLLLAPRDYLSTFMKLGTIFALALGVLMVLPDLKMPALTRFVDGSGLVVAGKLFPFCFITIACGAISGFHSLISSGTTPKLVARESHSRAIGYGAMCLESLVAIMAIIAACTLEPGVYLSMNVKAPGADSIEIARNTASKVNAAGFPVTVGQMNRLAGEIGEKTLFGRTGGAATLAVGMAQIFSQAVSNRWLDLWYHFAIMFEALFILTTLDAGTRVGRYLLQDALGNLWKPLGNTRNFWANLLASGLMVSAWGYFLLQGVRDPEGGIRALWPLFGIANQLLASIALCLGTTVILKMQLVSKANFEGRRAGRPILALVTFIPLLWLLAVTMTAGVEKIVDSNPAVGFLARARVLEKQLPALSQAVDAARKAGPSSAVTAAERALRLKRVEYVNNKVDAVAAGIFLALVGVIVLLSAREWVLLLARKQLAVLRENEAVWLPDYLKAETQPVRLMSLIIFGIALAKHLSGEAEFEHQTRAVGGGHSSREDIYLRLAEERFDGINRCC